MKKIGILFLMILIVSSFSAVALSKSEETIEVGAGEEPDYSIPNEISTALLVKLGVRIKDNQDVMSKVNLLTEKKIVNGETIYEITISAKENVKGLVLVEYFPKEIANVKDIVSTPHAQIAGNSLKIYFGELGGGQTARAFFSVKKIVEGANPSAILTTEYRKNVTDKLRLISYVMFFVFVVVMAGVHSRYKLLMSYVSKAQKHGIPEVEIKKHAMDSGWNVYVVKDLISVFRQKNVLQRAEMFWRRNRAVIALIALLVYILVFWIAGIGSIIFVREIYEVYFLAGLNALLIIWTGKLMMDYLNFPKEKKF